MLDQIIASVKDKVIQELMGKLGLNAGQAGGFLKNGLSVLEGGIGSGAISPTALTQGSPSGILSKLDLGPVASLVGGDTAKARTGMESILTPLMSGLKNNPGIADQLLGQLSGAGQGGIASRVTEFAGKIFGKH